MVPGISEKSGGVTSTILSDRLGSMKGMTNAGTVTETAEFDAFGKVISRTNPSATQKGFAGGHGYQEDGESGYKLLGHRYYDADTGRFLSRDPIGSGRNWYAYCDNSPLKAVDAEGLAWIVLCVDRRGLGHAWVMVIWDNGEVWIMENIANDWNQLYKSGTKDGKRQIDKFDGRADYEDWEYFDEKDVSRQDMRAAYNARPDNYNLLTNPCHLFAVALFNDVTGIWLYNLTPFDVGQRIKRRNVGGKGKRPKRFGDIGTVPITIGGGGLRIDTGKGTS